MPVNIVKTAEQERLWKKAKSLAAKQGRSNDWAYITGIFKKMGALDKSYLNPSNTLPFVRVPGQVPSRANLELQRLAQTRAKPLTIARLLDHDEPILAVSHIVDSLGFDIASQRDWVKFLETVLQGNELTLRQDILSRCLNERLDGAVRQVILQRALTLWREYKKSLIQVVSSTDLVKAKNMSKAEPRGGVYHRRVPTGNGSYKYYYDDKYRKNENAHRNDAEELIKHVSGKVQKVIAKAGDEGCEIDAFRDLVKKYGAKVVNEALVKNTGNSFSVQNNRFKSKVAANRLTPKVSTEKYKSKVKTGFNKIATRKPVSTEKKDSATHNKTSFTDYTARTKHMSTTAGLARTKKSFAGNERFYILEKGFRDTPNAGPHKYLTRKRGKEGWEYTYPEDLKTRIVNAILDFLSNPNRELTVGQAARSFRVDKQVAVEALNTLERQGKVQKKGDAWVGVKQETKPTEAPKPVETKKEEPEQVGYFHGNKIKYTGKVEQMYGGTFKEFVYLEGPKKGQKGHTVGMEWGPNTPVKEEPKETPKGLHGLHADSTLAEIKEIAEKLGREAQKAGKGRAPGERPDQMEISKILNPEQAIGNTKLITFMQAYLRGWDSESHRSTAEADDRKVIEEAKKREAVKKEEPKLVIPKKEVPKGTQLGLFDQPVKPPNAIEKKLEESVDRDSDKIIAELGKKDSTSVTAEQLNKPEEIEEEDTTVKFPLSSSQVRVLQAANTENGIDLQRIKGSTKQLIEHKLIVASGKKGNYKASALGKQWLADENSKPPKERTPKTGMTQTQAEEKADKTRKVLAVEQGQHVWGSRADIFAQVHTKEDLAKLTPEDQARFATKSYLLPEIDVEASLESGKTPGYILLRRAVENCIQSKADNNLESRQLYMEGVHFVQESLDACRSENDVAEFVRDYNRLLAGQRKVKTVNEETWGEATDKYLTSRGHPPKANWKERKTKLANYLEVMNHVNALDRSNPDDPKIDEWRKKSVAAYQEYKESKVEDYDQVGIAGFILGKTTDRWNISVSVNEGNYILYEPDPNLPAHIKNNPYARMAASLGKRFVTLVGHYNPANSGPKTYTTAAFQIRRWLSANVSKEDQIKQTYEFLGTKGKSAPKKPKFEWEREVSGEIDRRGGDPVSTADPKMFADEFGFSNVQFGHWVTEGDANSHLKGAHGALRDLSDIMGIGRKTVSLNGRLSIAFGARGSGKASAHYESSRTIINLTKMAGGGSLAHEWAHAMDNIIAKAHDPASTKAGRFVSTGDNTNVHNNVVDTFNDVMDTIKYAGSVDVESKDKLDRLNEHLKAGGKLRGYQRWAYKNLTSQLQKSMSNFYRDGQSFSAEGKDNYWTRPQELFARAFESYIEDTLTDQQRKSTYLVDGTKKRYATGKYRDADAETKKEHAQPYPQGEERKRINMAIKRLVDAIRDTKTLEKALRHLDFYILTGVN